MKWFIAFVLCLLSFNCLSQLLFGYTSLEPVSAHYTQNNFNKEQRIIIYPFQKTDFEIFVHNPKHKIVITDDNQNILYSQSKNEGHYEIVTGEKVVNVHVYDEGTSDIFNSDDDTPGSYIALSFHSTLKFGNKDAEVKIKVTLLPSKTDTINKHFVRLLALDEEFNPPCFSMSLEKIPPPTSRTEPIGDPYWPEDDVIVTNDIYLKVKNYFLSHARNFNDIKGSNVLEINIDFKDRFYVKSDDAIILLADFKHYLLKEKVNYDIPDRLDNMINGLEFKEPRDANGDPN